MATVLLLYTTLPATDDNAAQWLTGSNPFTDKIWNVCLNSVFQWKEKWNDWCPSIFWYLSFFLTWEKPKRQNVNDIHSSPVRNPLLNGKATKIIMKLLPQWFLCSLDECPIHCYFLFQQVSSIQSIHCCLGFFIGLIFYKCITLQETFIDLRKKLLIEAESLQWNSKFELLLTI